MFQVITSSNDGTYYPIAFFAEEEDARDFVEREKSKWKNIYFSQCTSAIMVHTLVDQSKWRIR